MTDINKDMQIQDLQMENSVLRDLLQQKMPVGCIAETTYQPTLDENEKLKEENAKLKQENKKLQGDRCILTKLKERVEYCEGIMDGHDDEMLEEKRWSDEKSQTIKEAYQENKKLKAELNDFVSVFDGNTSMKKMKEENDKLKTWISEFADFFDHDENHKGIYKKITGLDVEDDN
tara:strand:+ start:150 stop:674 length:525 start_codon:yes stop_codon:yes gene_type:complete